MQFGRLDLCRSLNAYMCVFVLRVIVCLCSSCYACRVFVVCVCLRVQFFLKGRIRSMMKVSVGCVLFRASLLFPYNVCCIVPRCVVLGVFRTGC